ncbi:MAG: hypothetical protein Kow0037_31040 [Calditrichia bacterium]
MRFSIYLVSLLLMVNYLPGSDSWEQQNSNTTEHLYSIHFVDNQNGWFAGANGIIGHTGNGGQVWQIQDSNTNLDINAIDFVDTAYGWAAGDSGVFLRTTNGGASWSVINLPEPLDISDMEFIDRLNGWMLVLSSPVQVWRTQDGGFTWEASELGTSFPALSLFVLDAQNLWLCGGFFDFSGYTSFSHDGGKTWSAPAVISSEPIFDLHFFDTQNGFAVGGDIDYGATAWKTNDGGESWIPQPAPLVLQPFFKLAVASPEIAWACGAGGRLYKYQFFSSQWTAYPVNTNRSLHDIQFLDENNGWLCGDLGFVARYTPLVKLESPFSPTSAANYYELAGYPNPFNPEITISLSLNHPATVTFRIFDVVGHEVWNKTIIGAVPPKTEVCWKGIDKSGSPLPSGVYILRAQIGEGGNARFQTTKLLLTR